MKIVVLGASGRTGRELVGQALDAGHEVTAVARTPEKVDLKRPYLHLFKADAKDAKALEEAFDGKDAVLSVIGVTPKNPDYHLMEKSARAIIEAAKAAKVKRVIILTSFVALPERLSFIVRVATKLGLGKIIADIQKMKKLLEDSDLDWTVIHATRLNNKLKSVQPPRIVPDDEKVGARHQISRADVAVFMLYELSDKDLIKKSVLISGKV